MENLNNTKQALDKAVKFLEEEYTALHTGRANPSLIEDIMVESYGAKTPLKGVASISVTDSKTINVQPWDKAVLAEIEKAVRESGLNISAVNTGEVVRVTLPALTEERRKEFVKIAKDKAEEAKVSIRNHRHEVLASIKKAKNGSEISEDEAGRKEKELQVKVDEYNKKIDNIFVNKEKDLLGI